MGVLRPIHRGIFEFCGMRLLKPEIAYAAAHGTEEDRRVRLAQWVERLGGIEAEEPIVAGKYV